MSNRNPLTRTLLLLRRCVNICNVVALNAANSCVRVICSLKAALFDMMKSQGRIPYRKVGHLLRFDFEGTAAGVRLAILCCLEDFPGTA